MRTRAEGAVPAAQEFIVGETLVGCDGLMVVSGKKK
jgi:hypothetical protein